MKKVILFILAILILSVNVIGVSAFSDVKDKDYFKEAAVYLDNNGIITGYEDGTFRGQGNITRAEMATIVCRLLEKSNEASELKDVCYFSDVSSSHWALGYINYAYNSKIINGDGNGNFRPEDYILYEEALKMILSASGMDKDIEWDYNNWAQVYVNTAQIKGLTTGQKGVPGEYVSRADVAVILYNILLGNEEIENPKTDVISIYNAEQMYALSRLMAISSIKKGISGYNEDEDLKMFSYPENITTKTEKIEYLKKASYELADDIELDFSISHLYQDISGYKNEFIGICVGDSSTVFSGTFNGNNKTITLKSSYGIKIENSNKDITFVIGLFGKMDEATVSNLHIKVNGDLKVLSSHNNYMFGLLAGEMNNCKISNVTVDVTGNSTIGIDQKSIGNRNSIVGCLAGNVSADKANYIRNCHIKLTDSTLLNSKTKESVGYMFTGGIVGKTSGTLSNMVKIEKCKVELYNSDIVAESDREISCVGGAVGDAKYSKITDVDVSLINSSIGAYTDGDTNVTIYTGGQQEYYKYAVGGILGFSGAGSNNRTNLGQQGNYMNNCTFKASMDKYDEILYAKEKAGTSTNVGGLVGLSFNNLTIEKSVVDVKNGSFVSERLESSVENTTYGSTVGGIIGRLEHTGRIADCVVNGESFDIIVRSTEKEIYAGGIVGVDIGPIHKKQVSLENNKVIGNGTTEIIAEIVKSDKPNSNIYLGGIAGNAGYQILNCETSGISLILNGRNIYEAQKVYMGKTAGEVTDVYVKSQKNFEWDTCGIFDCKTDNVTFINNLPEKVTVKYNEK
ncbi:MAG: S-layer homology domain-containing protein [Ruminococcaceae bacterium]|nr:S-layer homology domain-containing protein [Oscillospiraceae bacterium]